MSGHAWPTAREDPNRKTCSRPRSGQPPCGLVSESFRGDDGVWRHRYQYLGVDLGVLPRVPPCPPIRHDAPRTVPVRAGTDPDRWPDGTVVYHPAHCGVYRRDGEAWVLIPWASLLSQRP